MLVVAKDLQTQYEKALDRLAKHETRNSPYSNRKRNALDLNRWTVAAAGWSSSAFSKSAAWHKRKLTPAPRWAASREKPIDYA